MSINAKMIPVPEGAVHTTSVQPPGKDFSVIIQGPIIGKPTDEYEKQKTLQCINSVNQILPGAEIIISTWKGSDVSHLRYDKVIFNKDPGATSFNDQNKSYFNNSNRQIVSTVMGLQLATRKYAIKLRGDCRLNHLGFSEFLVSLSKNSKYNFLKQRIIVPTVYSRNPRRIPILFHPSDIFQAGLTIDLLDLWTVPLQPEPQTTRAVSLNKKILNDPYPGYGFKMQFAAEQYLWYAFAQKKGLDLNLKYYCEIPLTKIFKSELSIVNNYVIASPAQIGVILPDKFLPALSLNDLYNHDEWLQLYNSYCVKGYNITNIIKVTFTVYINSTLIVIKRLLNSVKRRFFILM